MRIIFFTYIIFYSYSINSQNLPETSAPDLLNTRKSFFTFKQSRISFGLGFETTGKWVKKNSEGIYSGNPLMVIQTNLSKEYEITKDTVNPPGIFSASVYFDLNAPNSYLSVMTGGTYNSLSFEIVNKSKMEKNMINISHLEIPFILKITLGKKFAPINPVLFFGGQYNIPISFNNENYLNERKALKKSISIMSGLAAQLNFRGKSGGGERLWVYIKATGLISNIFNENFKENILKTQSTDYLKYRDYRITFGLAFLLASHKKHAIK